MDLKTALDHLRPETREEIVSGYRELCQSEPGLPLREAHIRLSTRYKLPKAVVALAIRDHVSRGAPVPEAVYSEIVNRYVGYVTRMERPPNGRRKTIAKDLNLTYKTVAGVVRDWKNKQPRIGEIPRDARFAIEKAYFAYLEQGKGLKEFGSDLARSTGFSDWQVLRYIDLIHDREQELSKVPEVTTEQRESIEEGYRQYLRGDSPPEATLHDFLARKAGVDYKQVHRVLLEYRLDFKRRYLGK